MSRPVLAVMAGLLCTLLGMRHAGSLRREEREARRWADLLQSMHLLLGEGTLSLPGALAAAADGSCEADHLLTAMAQHMRKHPLSTPCEAYAALAAHDALHPCLQRMFTRLGQGTLESRCLAVQQAGAEMSLQAQQAARKAAADAKLFQTLGLTGGAALTLLLL